MRTFKSFVAFLLTAVLVLTGAPLCGINAEGTEFEVLETDDGFAYTVTDGKASIVDYTGKEVELVIPSTVDGIPVEAITEYAFDSCLVEKVTVSEGIQVISPFAFSYAEQLTAVQLPDSLKSIGNDAFIGCRKLESVIIPKGVDEISGNPFTYCTIKDISVDSGNTVFCAADGCLMNKNTHELVTGTIEGIIPENTLVIGRGAFEGYAAIEKVVIPEGVTEIGSFAFDECYSLCEIEFSSTVEVIGQSAFRSCDALSKVNFCEGLKIIDDYAFDSCTLNELEIPAGVINISSCAFSCNTALEKITVSEGNSVYYSSGNCVLTKEDDTLVLGCKKSVIPSNCKAIGNCAFAFVEIEGKIVIPDGVSSIGEGAFQNCIFITDIVIPDSVKSIGGWAFGGCTSLTFVSVPSGVEILSYGMFFDCSSLLCVELPKSVKLIEEDAFAYCPVLSHVLYKGTEEQWYDITVGALNDDFTSAKWHCEALPAVRFDTIPASCEEKGFDVMKCSHCDYQFYANYTRSLGHVFKNGTCSECEMSENEIGTKHPYDDNENIVWTIEKPGAERIELTFSEDSLLEDGFDFLYIFGDNDVLIDVYTSGVLAGKTISVEGEVVKLNFRSDVSLGEYGFDVTEIKAVYDDKGDVNLDGKINMADVVALRRYLVNSELYPVGDSIKADANSDGKLNMADVVAIRRYLVNAEKYPLGA